MNVIYMYCKILILKKITMERGKDQKLHGGKRKKIV